MKLGVLTAVVAALAASSSTAPRVQDHGLDLSAADRTACLKRGGFLAHYGMIGAEGCYFRFSDAGKHCSGSHDCKGRCIYPSRDVTKDRLKGGMTVLGRCEATSATFGCHSLVEHGRIRETLCVD